MHGDGDAPTDRTGIRDFLGVYIMDILAITKAVKATNELIYERGATLAYNTLAALYDQDLLEEEDFRLILEWSILDLEREGQESGLAIGDVFPYAIPYGQVKKADAEKREYIRQNNNQVFCAAYGLAY